MVVADGQMMPFTQGGGESLVFCEPLSKNGGFFDSLSFGDWEHKETNGHVDGEW